MWTRSRQFILSGGPQLCRGYAKVSLCRGKPNFYFCHTWISLMKKSNMVLIYHEIFLQLLKCSPEINTHAKFFFFKLSQFSSTQNSNWIFLGGSFRIFFSNWSYIYIYISHPYINNLDEEKKLWKFFQVFFFASVLIFCWTSIVVSFGVFPIRPFDM